MLAATLREIPVVEYSPKEVKKSVTGNGSADKEQVKYMVQKILNIKEDHKFLDATDALSVAICHLNKRSINTVSSGNWKDFIKNNPERIVKL
jgi:crossover junction endodeoxyribonuclease RuvC